MTTATAPFKPPVACHLFGRTREQWLSWLNEICPEWEWRIGRRRLGDPHFAHEHPAFELVSQWQPRHGNRTERYAVYARRSLLWKE
ncbi:MAG: hypothetical protein K2X87_19270 [Gemmataceae bacterium]|nr:hypothetical protein [Gemmataceae bacterium]